MNEVMQENENEIDLLDLFSILLQRKKMIISITLLSMIIIVLFSIISIVLAPESSPLPNVYEPKALLLINDTDSSSGGISSLLSSSGLGSLAGLAGLSIGSETSNSQLAVYLTTTNYFLDDIIDKFDLIKRYNVKKSVRAESRDELSKNLKAEIDTDSGVLTIQFKDIDPTFAQSVVNYSVEYLEKRFDDMGIDKNKLQKENLERNIANTYEEIRKLELETHALGKSISGYGPVSSEASSVLEMTRLELELAAQKEVYIQIKTQYELLKVAMASEKPVFQVLEYAENPDRKSGPSRGLLCIIVTFAAVFFSIFLAFILNAIENIKNDPIAMAKLAQNGKGTMR